MTKKQIASTVISWVLVAVCMIVIFCLSAQSGDDSQLLSDNFTSFLGLPPYVVNIVRKSAHFLEFTGLAVLIFNALYRTFGYSRPYMSLFLTSIYAATDEIHQIFVEGRACRLFDWFIDSLGAAAGISVLCFLIFLHSLYIKRKSRRGLI